MRTSSLASPERESLQCLGNECLIHYLLYSTLETSVHQIGRARVICWFSSDLTIVDFVLMVLVDYTMRQTLLMCNEDGRRRMFVGCL